MTAKGSYLRNKLARSLYAAGVVFLMVGMVLSMISQPAKAQSEPSLPSSSQLNRNGPGLLQDEQTTPEVTEEPAEELTQEETPVPTEEPGDVDTQPPTQEVTEEPTVEITEEPTEALTPTPEPTLKITEEFAAELPADVSGEANFTQEDYSICQFVAGPLNATIVVSLPEGVTGRLTTEFRVVNPPNKATGPEYRGYDVVNGDRITVEGYWPGVDAGDFVVEIHFGARLSYRDSGIDHELDTDGLDVYWYDWVCKSTPTPTPTPAKLNLTWECGFEGSTVHTWRVTNPNNLPLDFSWKVYGGTESGSGSVAANSLAYFTTPLSAPQTVILTTLPSGATTTKAAGSETCKEKLSFGYSCTDDDQITYYVVNPNDVDFTYTTTVNGTAGSSGSFGPGTTTLAVTANGANQVVIGWEHTPWTGSETINTPEDTCVPSDPEEDLVLTYRCLGTLIEWSVTNPNAYAIDFSWTSLDGNSGSDTAPATGSMAFFNATGWAANTVTANWIDVDENPRSVNESNTQDYCRSPETPETPTSTPVTETPVVTETSVVTETPDNQRTPVPSETPVPQQTPGPDEPLPTLAPPVVQGEALLIPVTGADLTSSPLAKWQQLFIYLGMACFGAAFLVQGSSRKRSE
jgi:hypothetical protein